jgi:hypothetical protein
LPGLDDIEDDSSTDDSGNSDDDWVTDEEVEEDAEDTDKLVLHQHINITL